MNEIYNKIQKTLDSYSTGKNVIILFVITQIVYLLMLLYSIPNVSAYAGGMKILDLLPTGYSADYAKSLLEKLGADGRSAYLYKQIPLDMIYPFLFALTYTLLLKYLFNKSFSSESKMHLLTIVPIFSGFFDYCENIAIIVMLTLYPIFSNFIAAISNIFSILKSVSTTLFFVLLFIGIAGMIRKKFANQNKRNR